MLVCVPVNKNLHVRYCKMCSFNFVQITESIYCSYTPQTVRVVDSCPESKAELKKREREKNCSFIANIQNCTKPANFKYHCVMNEFKNKFIEVCAVEFYIIGK